LGREVERILDNGSEKKNGKGNAEVSVSDRKEVWCKQFHLIH
jgi:hypothetical protein